MTTQHEITRLLADWSNGDRQALEKLTPLVYDELRRLAGRYLRQERAGHTLQTSGLVHEAYMRLVDADVSWQDKAHFLAVAARTMRRVLVDHARARRRHKRGGDAVRVDLDDVAVPVHGPSIDILALNDVLEKLAAFDERKSAIVELHFFTCVIDEEPRALLGQEIRWVTRQDLATLEFPPADAELIALLCSLRALARGNGPEPTG